MRSSAMDRAMSVLGPEVRAQTSLRVRLAVEQRYQRHLEPAALAATLQARGHEVTWEVADTSVLRLDGPRADWDEVDVVVARGRSPQLLTLLQAAEAAGVPTLNPAAGIRTAVDKAQVALRLARANLPAPPTWVGLPAELGRIPARMYPLVVKPVDGDNCRDVNIVTNRAALVDLPSAGVPVLAQRLVDGDGTEVKLYGVGPMVWAVRLPSVLLAGGGYTDRTPLPVTPALRGLAWRCARAVGLELYGVDCILTDDGPVVLEVNDFPNYTGVDAAPDYLADHVAFRVSRARGRRLAARSAR